MDAIVVARGSLPKDGVFIRFLLDRARFGNMVEVTAATGGGYMELYEDPFFTVSRAILSTRSPRSRWNAGSSFFSTRGGRKQFYRSLFPAT
jgi:hypothetical protein